ncbi:MAG TPA: alpha/beta hydrolase [Flavitalea sp.]|nr:alpha/beta hydrolase [Flavitalea sp.]
MQRNAMSTFNVTITGKGSRTILFAHGLACDHQVWKKMIPAFQSDYKVVVFDFIGSGETDPLQFDITKHTNLHGYADDILSICQEISSEPIIFVGHSVSGMIGLLASLTNKSIFSNLILICPSPCYINLPGYQGGFDQADIEDLLALMDENYFQWAKFFAPMVIGVNNKNEIADFEDLICKADPRITRQFAEVAFLSDHREDLEKVSVPTVILQGSEDMVANSFVSEFMHSKITGSQLKLLAATGHCPHITAPEETVMVIKKYLETRIK